MTHLQKPSLPLIYHYLASHHLMLLSMHSALMGIIELTCPSDSMQHMHFHSSVAVKNLQMIQLSQKLCLQLCADSMPVFWTISNLYILSRDVIKFTQQIFLSVFPKEVLARRFLNEMTSVSLSAQVHRD